MNYFVDQKQDQTDRQLPSSVFLRRLMWLLAKGMVCYFRLKEIGFSSLYLSC